MIKRILKITAFVLVLVLVLFAAQRVLTPKYVSEALDGRLIAEYYDSTKNHDIVFVGDCEVYENISPITLWEDYGISSYVRGSPQQLIWHSYYLMEETLRYEKPEAFVFNVLSMKYGEPQSEAYNRLALDGMKWSGSKADAINASMTEEETFISYLFPLLRFHSRWSELKAEDFEYAFKKVPQLSINGYLMRVDVDGIDQLRKGQELGDYTIADVCWEYLDKMRTLCEENGVELILMKAPTNTPQCYWYDQWDVQVKAYAEKHGLRYYNFLEVTDEIGLDYNTDTYDQGFHLNLSGAEKLSAYFGGILTEELGLKGHHGEAEYEQIWTKLSQQYDQIRETQERLLKENGKLTGFTGLE
ncbi:MAG: SGNH/GDSL hydrolase family protein [Oscillospiraceae bacterium]|nr:SGNH/GDSL hydrolase family protein [Oscillospiraceae bacterium]